VRVTSIIFLSLISVTATQALPGKLSSIDLLNAKSVEINLKDGKPKVFVFMSAKCPCSASHEAIVAALSQEFKDIPFFAIHSNANEKLLESKEHFRKTNLPFTVLQDGDVKIADEFGALKTPHAYVVNGSGKIIYSGGVTNSTNGPAATKQLLKEALLNVRAGKDPDPSEVRTLGCVIARP